MTTRRDALRGIVGGLAAMACGWLPRVRAATVPAPPPMTLTESVRLTLIRTRPLPFDGNVGVVMELTGRLNDRPFGGHAAGCVLFLGASTERTFRDDGTTESTIAYTFDARQAGRPWGRVLTPKGWRDVRDGAGNPLYLPADFSALRPDAAGMLRDPESVVTRTTTMTYPAGCVG